MISLSNMRTSQIEELAARLAAGGEDDAFITSVVRFLTAFTTDGGADEDLIFVTGKRLSSHEIWQHIPASKLRIALHNVPMEAKRIFLERAPDVFQQQVLAPKPASAGVSPKVARAKRRYIFGQAPATPLKRNAAKSRSAKNKAQGVQAVPRPAVKSFDNYLAMSMAMEPVELSVRANLQALGVLPVLRYDTTSTNMRESATPTKNKSGPFKKTDTKKSKTTPQPEH